MEWKETKGDSTLDTNGDYLVQRYGVAEMSQRTRVKQGKIMDMTGIFNIGRRKLEMTTSNSFGKGRRLLIMKI